MDTGFYDWWASWSSALTWKVWAKTDSINARDYRRHQEYIEAQLWAEVKGLA